MTRNLFTAAAFLLTLLIAAPAQSGTIRYPEGGRVAFIINAPDDWTRDTSNPDALRIWAPDETVAVTFTVAEVSGTSFDAQMADWMRQTPDSAPLRNKSLKVISGHFGAEYDSDMPNKEGGRIAVHMAAVPFSGSTIGIAAISTAEHTTTARRAEARAIYDGLTIIDETPSSLDSWR